MASKRRAFGSIEERKGVFYAKYRGPDGVRRYAPHPFVAQRDAEVFLLGCQRAIAAGEWTPRFGTYAAGVTVGELLDEYLHGREEPLAPLTLVDYEKLARTRILPALGSVPADTLSRPDVRQWLRSLPADTARSNGKALQLLSAALQYGVVEELVKRNVAQGVAPPRVRARDRRGAFIPSQQFGDYLQTLRTHEPDWFAILATDLLTGLRSGELRGLQVRDLDLDGRELRVRRQILKVRDEKRPGRWLHVSSDDLKTEAGQRDVSIPEFLCEILRQHLQQNPRIGEAWLFPAQDGGPLNSAVLLKAHYRVTERMGLRTPKAVWNSTPEEERVAGPRLHDLRASASTWLAEQGATVPELMARFGWASPAMPTTIYARANRQREQRFMEEQDAVLRASLSEG